jgi:hypothetical protein
MMFAFVICVLYSIGDPDKVLSTPTGLSILEVYYEATNNKHATNFLVIMLAFSMFIGQFNLFASVSRLVWSFATDKGLPFSNTFARVSVPIFSKIWYCLF